MVVDDDSFTIGLVKDVLYAGGAAEVFTALDGAEAIAMLSRCQPHLVVTDWRMPQMDGLAFTKIVRQAAVRPDERIPDPAVPIVLLSAHASAKAVETARRAGVSEVVVKPFAIATLLTQLAAAAGEPRAFVVSETYVGPDRRRRQGPNAGRRAGDHPAPEAAGAALTGPIDISALKRLKAKLEDVEGEARKPQSKAAARAENA